MTLLFSRQCQPNNMFKFIQRRKFIVQGSLKNFSTTRPKTFKVAVIGACGGVGAPMSMLLKMNPLITELRIHDLVKHTPGVGVDISHIEYPAHVSGHVGEGEGIKKALCGSDVVVISAGVPRKPGMSRDDLFTTNATIIKQITEAISQSCPAAMIAIITNPINTVVPISCEIMKAAGKLDPKRIFGITTLDNVRAAAFISEKMKISPKDITVPVIGGHSPDTIIPLFSKAHPKVNFPLEEIKALTKRIQEAGTEVVKAKQGAGSATLSMAYAAARFVNSLLSSMKGEPKIVECTYVKTKVCEALEYFAAPVVLGKNGVEQVCPIKDLNEFETELLGKSIPVLKKNIQKGIDYVKSSSCNDKKKEHDPCAKKNDKKHHDPCANDKKKNDPCAKHDDKKDKKHDPCAKGDKKDHHDNKDKKHDPCAKTEKKEHHEKKDKKHDPCAKTEKKEHHEKKDNKHDPCAKTDKKEHHDSSAKDKKHDPCAKNDKKEHHDPCAKNDKKHKPGSKC